ncbi:MAG: hypothetical protein ACLVF0_06740 [Dorea formicigenerans]|jgi:hypothetical protein|uniref:hypothetical protein n=1 Tax=Dorea formicigenerans TaxID=39486 RepID=UPI0032195448
MTGKKKILLIVIILLLGVAFIGIGFVLTQSTTSTTKTSAKTEEGTEQEKKTGMVGDKVAAEKLIDQTVTRDEIEEKVGEWNNFELDGAGCERGVYAGKFFYDNILINSRTYDKGETFRIVTVQDQ